MLTNLFFFWSGLGGGQETPKGAGWYPDKKKRYLVERDGRKHYFSRQDAAIEFLAKDKERNPTKPPKVSVIGEDNKPLPETHEVRKSVLVVWPVFTKAAVYQAFSDRRDEDDVELLLIYG